MTKPNEPRPAERGILSNLHRTLNETVRMTPVEAFLFQSCAVHWVFEFTQSEERLMIAIAPLDLPHRAVTAEFENARITAATITGTHADDLNPPWDILGFESRLLGENRWRFVLCTSGFEYTFEARWPRIVRRG